MSASLWLVPPEKNPFTVTVQELITDTAPSNFARTLKEKHIFPPHVTLTSQIDPKKTYEAAGKSPQEWLDSLTLPEFRKEFDEVVLELDHVTAGDAFFRKLVMEINDNENLKKLATSCRLHAELNAAENSNGSNEDVAQRWAKTEYAPHMSLLYADLPTDEVKRKLPLVESQIGFGLGSLFACCGGTFCMGGAIVLVPTDLPIAEWKPIASRSTPWVNWRMSRNLA